MTFLPAINAVATAQEEPPMSPLLSDIDPTSLDDDIHAVASDQSLFLTPSVPRGNVQIHIEEFRCEGASEPTDIELLAFANSDSILQHARIFLDQADADIVVGQGPIVDNKTNHGVVLNELAIDPDCVPKTREWDLHIVSDAPASAVQLMLVPHDEGLAVDNKTNHGVLLLD